mgnify:CR=1 FL=1
MDWKKLGMGLLFPPIWSAVLLTVLSTISLIYVFTQGLSMTVIAYIVYVISFYTLVVVCAYCVKYLPGYTKRMKGKINDNPMGHKFLHEATFRANMSLQLSLLANVLYVGVNIFFYAVNRSMWFVILAVYYTILVIVRLILVKYVSKDAMGSNHLGELRMNAICSAILLTVNIVLSGAVLMILYQDKGFTYNGVLIYVMALYTFYTTIHAIVTLVKYRKLNSPVMTTIRAIQLFAALVSMLSLETAMFSQFGQDMALEHKRLMIILTGAGVSITVLIMSVYMIAKSVKTIKNIKE